MHIPTDYAGAEAMKQAIYSRRPPYQGPYNMYTNNCAQFVEDVLHAGSVAGVPGHGIFGPYALWDILLADGY